MEAEANKEKRHIYIPLPSQLTGVFLFKRMLAEGSAESLVLFLLIMDKLCLPPLFLFSSDVANLECEL